VSKDFLYLGARRYLPQLFNVLTTVKGITDNSLSWKLQIHSRLHHLLLKKQSWFIVCSHESRKIVWSEVDYAKRDDSSSGSIACVTQNTPERRGVVGYRSAVGSGLSCRYYCHSSRYSADQLPTGSVSAGNKYLLRQT